MRDRPEGAPELFGGTHPSGALLARVGATGEISMVGERYAGTPKEHGRLQLRTAPSPWPGQAQGSYKAIITPNPVR